MIPLLLEESDYSILHSSLFPLVEASECLVSEELNGAYEMKMKYPVWGAAFSHIKLRSLISAKANHRDEAQIFRVYRITKPMNGFVSIYAQHISYDLSNVPVLPFKTRARVDVVVDSIGENAVLETKFTLGYEKPYMTRSTSFSFDEPRSIRSLLIGEENSIVSEFGGFIHFDGYNATYLPSSDNVGLTSISYGINLIDFRQEENNLNVYTAFMPYAKNEEGEFIYLDGTKFINASGNFGYTKILAEDLTQEFVDENGEPIEINEPNLRKIATDYMAKIEFGVPEISMDAIAINLQETIEYKDSLIEGILSVGDIVGVYLEKIGISTTAIVSATIYNSLKERYEQILLGKHKKRITDTIVRLTKKVENR